MPKTPDEYAVHIMLTSGHRQEVRFTTLQEFQDWYSSKLMPNANDTSFLTVPMSNSQGEYMVIRPSCVAGIRVEPIFAGSIDRDF